MNAPFPTLFLAALLATATCRPARADDAAPWPVPEHGVIGVDEAKLTPGYWIARLADPDRVVLDAAAIAADNARLRTLDPSMHDLHALPARLDRALVAGWIEALSGDVDEPLHDTGGNPIPAAARAQWLANRAVDAIAERADARYGLVVARADLRRFPTATRVFSEPGDTDIDRFQESALFPGTPVVIAHASGDGRWWFVVSPLYAAWIERRLVAEGAAREVFAYAERTPYRIVTGATVTTVATPEQAAVSRLQLDMSTRVPVLADWPADRPVNGEHPYSSHVIELPLRRDDGTLTFTPALLQKRMDTNGDYLPLTRANLLRQAFKFLGERYGWGHSYDARDCSGFVSDVYRSMGVQMPRNTRDQSLSAGLRHTAFGDADDHAARVAAARALEVGDLVYIPGHVMMAIGIVDGEPYVIHDTTGFSYRRQDGTMARVHLNAVSVSPLLPLQFNDKDYYVDRMTSIVRIRPDATKDATTRP